MKLPSGLHFLVRAWQRLESRSRDGSFWSTGLQARTADPLWFMTRQWVFGEYEGEDAGSLVKVALDYETENISQLSKDGVTNYVGMSDVPLEVLVESEAIPWDWRMRIRAGQQLERYIRAAPLTSLTLSPTESETESDPRERLIGRLRRDYAVGIPPQEDDIDEASLRYIKLMRGRAIDGKRFRERTGDGDVPVAVINNWNGWLQDLFWQSDEPTSWRSDTLEYKFGVSTDKSTVLLSDHYRNGDLEWYTSNLRAEPLATGTAPPGGYRPPPATPGPGAAPPLLPTRVRFAGMANPRWWTMEDSVLDFGKIDVNRSELIKTMLMNFTLVHGDDWFIVPLTLPTGSLTHVRTVTTTDVFGVKQHIRNGRVNDGNPIKRWDLFSLSKHEDVKRSADRDFLYIPPSSGFREESEAIEEVLFIRDENANMVWGIERKGTNAWGNPFPVREKDIEKIRKQQEAVEPAAGAGDNSGNNGPLLKFQLATRVANNWVPYLPARIAGSLSQIALKQGLLPGVDDDVLTQEHLGSLQQIRTRILAESKILNEETITRAGVLVRVNKQRLRWTDGKTYVWVGRSVVTGRGEGSSDLEFDVVNRKKL